MNEEKLVVKVMADVSDLNSGMKKVKDELGGLSRSADGSANGINKAFEKTKKQMEDLGNTFKSVGKKLTLGLTLPLIGLATIGIKAASDLQEVQNVVDVAFGDSAEAVNAWSKTTLEAFGLTQLQSKKYSSTIKAMTKAMGISGVASDEMAFSIAGLAGDMASFYNLDPEEAFNKLKAGLTGETEPLKALGIVVSDASVKAYALKNHIGKLGEELTDTEKVTARYGLIMQLTSDSQGDFSRTSDSFANQMKIVKGRFVEVAGQLMESLLPALEGLLTKVQSAISWFANMDEGQKKTVLTLGAVAIALGPVISLIGTLITVGSGIGGLVTAIAGFGTASAVAGGAAGVGALTTGLAGAALAAIPFIAAGALVAGVGYIIYDALSSEAIPEIDLFADHVSYASETVTDEFGNIKTVVTDTSVVIGEETEAQITAFMALDEEARRLTQNMYMGIADNTGAGWSAIRTAMGAGMKLIMTDIAKNTDEQLKEIGVFFSEETTMTDKEMTAVFNLYEEDGKKRIEQAERINSDITMILDKAQRENRTLTIKEQADINKLLDEGQTVAVQTYATSEAEQKVILNRLAQYNGRVTAVMVSDSIKEFKRMKDETVAKAGETRDEQIRIAEDVRLRGGASAQALADKMIKEANRMYDEEVKVAEGIREDGVNKIMDAHSDLAGQVDTETGRILTAWDKVKAWWNSWNPKSKSATVTTNEVTVYSNRTANDTSSQYGASRNAAGTNFFKGGLTSINEVGGEIIDLPKGTRIIPHDISEKMAESSGRESTTINLNGNYGFRDKNDMDYFMNQIALVTRRE